MMDSSIVTGPGLLAKKSEQKFPQQIFANHLLLTVSDVLLTRYIIFSDL